MNPSLLITLRIEHENKYLSLKHSENDISFPSHCRYLSIFVSMLSNSYLTIKLNSSDATDKNLPGHYCPWYKKPMAGQWGKWLMKSRIKLRIGCLIPTFPSWSKWHELRGIRRWDEGREPGRCTMSSHAVKRKRTKKGYIIKRQDILLTLLHIRCCRQAWPTIHHHQLLTQGWYPAIGSISRFRNVNKNFLPLFPSTWNLQRAM